MTLFIHVVEIKDKEPEEESCYFLHLLSLIKYDFTVSGSYFIALSLTEQTFD